MSTADFDYHLKSYFFSIPVKHMRDLMSDDLFHYVGRFEDEMIKKSSNPHHLRIRFSCFKRVLDGTTIVDLAKEFDRSQGRVGMWIKAIYRRLVSRAWAEDKFDFVQAYRDALTPLVKADIERKAKISERDRLRYEAEERAKELEAMRRLRHILDDERQLIVTNLIRAKAWQMKLLRERPNETQMLADAAQSIAELEGQLKQRKAVHHYEEMQ